MAFYDEMQAMASELLAEFGQAVTHTSVAEGVYNPATASTTNTPTTQTGIGALFELTLQDAGVIQAAGGLVQANDRKLLLSTAGIAIAPLPNDTLTVDAFSYVDKDGETVNVPAVTYTVLKAQTLAPAGIVVMYELQLRR